MTKTAKVNRKINAEFLGELPGVEGYAGYDAYNYRYTVQGQYADGVAEIIEVTNEKGTVGALLFYHYVNYISALDEMITESSRLATNAERSVERIKEYAGDTQLWVLEQNIARINEKQREAQKNLDMCYIYVNIITGKVRA